MQTEPKSMKSRLEDPSKPVSYRCLEGRLLEDDGNDDEKQLQAKHDRADNDDNLRSLSVDIIKAIRETDEEEDQRYLNEDWETLDNRFHMVRLDRPVLENTIPTPVF
jgi:hypothetical protein